MKYLLTLCIVLLANTVLYAQYTVRLSIKSTESTEALDGATGTIVSLNKTSIADNSGLLTFENIPAGNYKIKVSFIGMQEQDVTVGVPQPDSAVFEVLLLPAEEEEEEVVVTATRISRTIVNIPTRVEVISGEELAEKANMKPGDIRMLLNESTGIQTQQTSATSFNAAIRIQGLDGRYTQLLRDGYPLYAGFAGGLSILQIAPLDLRQVEVIKGSASTLYGGGAIAGLVNLVSKTPRKEKELSFLANGTSAGGLDLSGFYSQRYGSAGITLFASRNSNRPYDPAGIGLTAIPKFQRYTINPRLFLYGKKTTADVGISFINEHRTGGSISYIKNGASGYFETSNTDRITTQAGVVHRLNENSTLQFKNSYSHFQRIISIPAYTFNALQQSSFSELTWNKSAEKADWVIGANLLTEDLSERIPTTDPKRDYHYNTFGLFAQNAWTLSENLVVETGLRGDYIDQYRFVLLPRISGMLKLSESLTTRLGGGLGYKAPTIYSEETERIQFRNLLPIDVNTAKHERSLGGNWDINYRTKPGAVDISLNHLFFYTRLNNPLVLFRVPGSPNVQFQNPPGWHLDTKGMETNLRLVYEKFKLFLGYTYTDANWYMAGNKESLPLTAKHRLNNVLMYEIEDKLKLGLEAYYFSRQRLNYGETGKAYWIAGFMAEKLWEKFSVYVNFENFTDTRQTKFGTIYLGSIDNPVFKDIYAPLDGFVVNGGIKVRL